MYVQGVSTHNVAAITEQLCGTRISSMQVSRAAKMLDEELEIWRNRPLGNTPYLFLDARYEKVRHGGRTPDQRSAVFPERRPALGRDRCIGRFLRVVHLHRHRLYPDEAASLQVADERHRLSHRHQPLDCHPDRAAGPRFHLIGVLGAVFWHSAADAGDCLVRLHPPRGGEVQAD